VPNQDFVDAQPIAPVQIVSGTVEEDVDGDDSAEQPISGVVITIVDGDGVTQTTTTDANGDYSFMVAAGDFTITEMDPAGFTSVSDIDGANDNVIQGTVPSGGMTPDQDFLDEQPAMISGTVELDSDNNGTGDTPIAGVIITVEDSSGAMQTTMTDASGNYSFTVRPGPYTITETDPQGLASVSDVDGANDNIVSGTVPPGGNVTDQDFVDEQPVNPMQTVSGTVTEDTNGDGIGDTPIPNVSIVIQDGSGATQTALTDGSGDYSFTVAAGDFTITETDPAGFTSVSDVDGANDNIITGNVPVGGDVPDQDFVDEQPSTVSGTVLEDTTGDGIGDTPISGVTVTIEDSTGAVQTTTTDGNGNYTFTVSPGEFTITETDPSGLVSVSDTDGNNDNMIDGTVAPGDTSANNNFVDEEPDMPMQIV